MRIRILVPLLLIALGATAQGKKTVFSTMETNHIRVATPGLFSQRELIELPLEDIPDTEYSFPLPGGKVISPYGRGRGRHSGIDIKTYAKDTIRSAFNGVVRMSKPYSAYGNVVVVRHDFGLETIYSHNFKNLVHCGDTVKAGQPIALTGRTGRASTEHLHFETRVNGQHFDPNTYLQHEGTDADSDIARYVDLFLFDIKQMDPVKHKQWTGVNNEQILANIRALLENGFNVRVRMPLLHGVNDDKAEIDAMIEIFTPYRYQKNFDGVDLLPYHKLGVGKYAQLGRDYEIEGDPSLSEDDLNRIEGWVSEADFKVSLVRH